MKAYRDTQQITKKEQLGRRLSMIGLAVLFVGLLSSFTPNRFPPDAENLGAIGSFLQQYWTWISLVALASGFMFANIGSHYINRFARRRWPGNNKAGRPDEVFQRTMKGFDDKYAFFAHSLPADYALVGPCGLLLFAVRSDRGKVVARGDRWREPFSISRIFTAFSREGVGNPVQDLVKAGEEMRTLLDEAGDEFKQVPIAGAAVFINTTLELEVDNPTVPALRGDQVKGYIRGKAREVKLTTSTLRSLTRFLAENSTYQESEDE